MGNCMETCRERQEEEKEKEEEEEKERNQGEEEKGSGYGGVRVKIMLTKEELEWMMFQLKDKAGGGKSLEDVLREIDRSRSAAAPSSWRIESWRPSLECIMESPELLEMDR